MLMKTDVLKRAKAHMHLIYKHVLKPAVSHMTYMIHTACFSLYVLLVLIMNACVCVRVC